MKTNKEIAQLLLDNIHKLDSGICSLLTWLQHEGKISNNEYIAFDFLIWGNTPKRRYRALYVRTFTGKLRICFKTGYWWRPGRKNPRKRWLKSVISGIIW